MAAVPNALAYVWGLIIAGIIPGMPMSLPPLPPDPVVARAVPDECLVYVHFAGRAVPQQSSGNQTEKLLAEAEVQSFVSKIGDEIKKNLTQSMKADPQLAPLADELPSFLKVLGSSPLTFYLSSFELGPEGPQVRGALIVNTGENAALCESFIKKLQEVWLVNGPPGLKVEPVTVAGVSLNRLPMPPGAPGVIFGFRKQYLVVGIGSGGAEELLTQLKDKNRQPPSWYKEVQQHVAVEREAATHYVNVAGILKAAAPAMADPKVASVLAALGVDGLASVSMCTGLDKEGVSSRAWLEIDGEPKGLFALAKSAGVTEQDLAGLPAGALMAQAFRLSLEDVYQRVLAGVGEVEPQAKAMAEQQIQQVSQGLGLSVEDDLLKPLGDLWTFYSLPGQPMSPTGDFVLTVTLKDGDRFAATHERLLGMAKAILAQSAEGKFSVQESEHAGNKLFSLQGLNTPMMQVAPTWCITKDRLLVTISQASMQAALSQDSQSASIATVAAVKKMLSSEAPTQVGYYDSATSIASIYPLYGMFAPTVQSMLAGQGISLTLPTLPSQDVVLPHIGPAVSSIRYKDGGILWDRTYTFPVLSGGDLSKTGVAMALLLPAVQAAREAARRQTSINNMKQIMLAKFNHHDAMKTFPSPAVCDKEGKPLLSWRVKILPYLEENALYQEFHLDEPWDSEHNKKLIPRMPAVYLNPARQYKGDGTTTYLLPTGEKTLFKTLDGKVGLRNITDGTSKTIAVLEVAEGAAVPWTKPDDLKFDPEQPLAGLKGARVGGVFLVAMADGSVRALPESIDLELLKALFTRDGGEAIETP